MQIMSELKLRSWIYLHAALLLLFLKLILRSSSIRSPLEGAPGKRYRSSKFWASDYSACLQSHMIERFSPAFLCMCVTHLLSGWRLLCGHRLRTLEDRGEGRESWCCSVIMLNANKEGRSHFFHNTHIHTHTYNREGARDLVKTLRILNLCRLVD